MHSSEYTDEANVFWPTYTGRIDMNTVESIRVFLGWCSVINIGLLTISTISIVIFRNQITLIHAKLFNLDKHYISRSYYKFIGQYKIVILVFNIVPYLALSIMNVMY